MVRQTLAGIAVLLLGIATAASDRVPARFDSPGGKFRVQFERLELRRFTQEEALINLDNVDHVRYRVSFLRASDDAVVATEETVDVYGNDARQEPWPLDVVFGWLSFSPEEDFVILPAEGWASAPGTTQRTALALNDTLGWSTAPLTLEQTIWAGPLVAVGDRHNDCDYSVDLFDGASGEQKALLTEPASPLGSELVEVVGREIRIATLLDNCSSEEQRRSFEPTCYLYDLDARESRIVPCR